MSKKSIAVKISVLLVVAAAAVALVAVASLRKTVKSADPVLPVETVKVLDGTLEKSLGVSGFMESDSMVTLLPMISGRVTDIYPEMGDYVEKDQVVARIDRAPYQLSWNQAQAAYLAAQSTFTRVSGLMASNSVSRQNYDEAKANSDAARASFELADLNLGYTEVKSPVSGVVLEKHISAGAMAAPQIPIVTIGDLEHLKVNCGIPELHYAAFLGKKDTMDVKIAVPALDDRIFHGGIRNVAPYISPGSRNFTVICSVDDRNGELRPGMFVRVDFVLEKRENIQYLPYGALSGGFLWYVDGDGKAASLAFDPDFGNDEYFQVPGEWKGRDFIISGQAFLDEGRPVRITGK